MRYLLLACGLFIVFPSSIAAFDSAYQEKFAVNLSNTESLQRGAGIFRNYCLSCHSAAYMRYDRMAKDLLISEAVLKENFIFNSEAKPGDLMNVAMTPEAGLSYFGVAPPDLSVIARSRGADWLYSYLKTFYVDPERPFGVNNLVFKNTAMPHVLWELQGLQKPVYKSVKTPGGGNKEVIDKLVLASPGSKSLEEYDQLVGDLVNFLVYLGEPIKLKRTRIGSWVLFYLVIFFILAYFLKKEYWRDVH